MNCLTLKKKNGAKETSLLSEVPDVWDNKKGEMKKVKCSGIRRGQFVLKKNRVLLKNLNYFTLLCYVKFLCYIKSIHNRLTKK